MTRRRTFWAATLLVGLVALPTGGPRVFRSLSRAITFPGCADRFPAATLLERSGVRLLRYRTADGVALEGALVPSGKEAATTVVYFHGNGEAAAQNLPMARELAARGYDVLLVEYRGYGGMPGAPTEGGLYADAEAAIAALGVPAERLVLVGRSLGTGVAVEMAVRGHGAAVVLISPYTSMVEMGRLVVGPLAAIAVTDRFDTASKVGGLSVPVTILHGTRDEVVPFAMGEALSKRVRRCRFVALEGVGHNDIPDVAARVAAALAAPPE